MQTGSIAINVDSDDREFSRGRKGSNRYYTKQMFAYFGISDLTNEKRRRPLGFLYCSSAKLQALMSAAALGWARERGWRHRLYVARTYAYVANGPEGLAIMDVENPERPRLDQTFSANGELNDTHAVQIGSVNASMFARRRWQNGLRVIQLISPDTAPCAMGFSPRPNPRLIATYHTHGEAIAVSRGLDRDRVVDETGHPHSCAGRARFRAHSAAQRPAATMRQTIARRWRVKKSGAPILLRT